MSLTTPIMIRFLSGAQTRRLLPMQACIDAVREAMVQVSRGNVALPLRHAMPIPNGKGMLGMMYGYLGEPEAFGMKLASLYPGNTRLGLSSHMGLMILYEADKGAPLAIMDASVVTAVRTAAASAAATERLARKDAAVLAILGTGEQADTHLESIAAVRELEQVRIWGRSAARAEALAAQARERVRAPIALAGTAEEAVTGADIICTVTSSPDPILMGDWVAPGTHVNLVGSSFPDRREVDDDLVVRSRFFVDYRESALAQAGEFLGARARGLVDDTHIAGEIGQVFAGDRPGRANDSEITVYKSLGIIAQDIAAAMLVWRAAQQHDVGQTLEL